MMKRSATLLTLLTFVATAHGLQRVNLTNGFSYDCLRQEPLDATHVRLYLADNATIDLAAASIASVEILPDPPAAPSVQPVEASAARPDLRTFLTHAGAQHNIDVELLASIAKTESSGNVHAVSPKGAQGLMQLMPSTARQMGVADSFQPEGNINGGAAYLDRLLTRYKDNLALALAAYNAGPGAVDRYHGIPPFRETRAYVVRVMTEFKRRKQALAAGSTLASR